VAKVLDKVCSTECWADVAAAVIQAAATLQLQILLAVAKWLLLAPVAVPLTQAADAKLLLLATAVVLLIQAADVKSMLATAANHPVALILAAHHARSHW
jgi:hypothetical protein